MTPDRPDVAFDLDCDHAAGMAFLYGSLGGLVACLCGASPGVALGITIIGWLAWSLFGAVVVTIRQRDREARP
jgi:hypothetical protein